MSDPLLGDFSAIFSFGPLVEDIVPASVLAPGGALRSFLEYYLQMKWMMPVHLVYVFSTVRRFSILEARWPSSSVEPYLPKASLPLLLQTLFRLPTIA